MTTCEDEQNSAWSAPPAWKLMTLCQHFLTFIIWSSLCRWASPHCVDCILPSVPQQYCLWKQRKKPGLNVINPNLFGLLTLTFPHIFSLSQHTLLLSLSLPRWHVDSSLLVGISFQWAGWEGQRDVVIISISGCLAAFPSACWQTLAIEQLSGRKGVGCGLKLHRSRSFLSKSHWS